jgi:hypothetical protein
MLDYYLIPEAADYDRTPGALAVYPGRFENIKLATTPARLKADGQCYTVEDEEQHLDPPLWKFTLRSLGDRLRFWSPDAANTSAGKAV